MSLPTSGNKKRHREHKNKDKDESKVLSEYIPENPSIDTKIGLPFL